MPYMPTWNNPYLPMYQQQPQFQMQYPQPQSAGLVKADGPAEAMNRLLMEHANQLNPGFISDPVFDIDGKRFYVLSVEPDGRRNLETFDYALHVEQEQPDPLAACVGRDEFDALMAKVDKLEGALNGIHEPVQQQQQPIQPVQQQPARNPQRR